jgi:hypothetical protein
MHRKIKSECGIYGVYCNTRAGVYHSGRHERMNHDDEVRPVLLPLRLWTGVPTARVFLFKASVRIQAGCPCICTHEAPQSTISRNSFVLHLSSTWRGNASALSIALYVTQERCILNCCAFQPLTFTKPSSPRSNFSHRMGISTV